MQLRKRSSKILMKYLFFFFTEIFKSLVCYEIYASIWCRMVYNALKQVVSLISIWEDQNFPFGF